jgi:hypothetical protein
MHFQRNISLLFRNGRLVGVWSSKVELAGGAKLTALMEKATAGPLETVVAGPCALEKS